MGLMLGSYLAPQMPRSTDPILQDSAGKTAMRLEAFNYRGVQLSNSRFKEQYIATRNYYFNLPNDDILKGFRKRGRIAAPGNDMGAWGSEDTSMVFGQWLSGMARMHRATGDTAMGDKASYLMAEWAKTIEPDGTSYLPTLARDMRFSHYAWDKLLGGLLDMYEYSDEKAALPLAEKITDWGVKNLDRTRTAPVGFDISGFPPEWYTLCENLYRAWQLTGDPKYKTFGDLWRYEHYWGMFTGKVPLNLQDYHAYSHANSLSSAAMTYAVTGEPGYLKTIVNAHDHFQQVQCYATGGYGPSEKLVKADGALGKSLEREANTFETPCGSWAVFKLGRYLLQFTGEARFGDWIEQILYNGIGAALPMGSGGKTFYYSDYTLGPEDRIGSARKVYYWDPFPCCSGTYIQAVADYHNIIYFKDQESLYVNLYVPSTVTWDHSGQEVRIEQETTYPRSDTAVFAVQLQKSAPFNLKFRLPGWSQGAEVQVNGNRFEAKAEPGTWLTVRRLWSAGDLVTVRIAMHARLIPIDREHPQRVAVGYGPLVLAQDARYTMLPKKTPRDPDLTRWIRRRENSLEFHLVEPPETSVFAPEWGAFLPFYQMTSGVPYRMYFDLRT